MKVGKVIITLMCVLVVLFCMGCNKTNENNIVTDNYSKTDFSIDEFSKKMEAKNYTFQLKDVSKDHFLPTARKRMIIDKEVIDIYLYNNNNSMEKDAKGIHDGGYSFSNGTESINVSWGVSHPHFYKKGNIIILYVGENIKIISDLKDIFGEQFEGKK